MYDNWSVEDLKWKIRELKGRISDLEEENRTKDQEIDHLRFRIENELEPLIRAQRNAYDRWVSDPERSNT